MGEFVFTAPGIDERLLAAAGFTDVHVEDVTPAMARVALLRRNARERYATELSEIEGDEGFRSIQEFLTVVHVLAGERRLSRFAYLATKKKALP